MFGPIISYKTPSISPLLSPCFLFGIVPEDHDEAKMSFADEKVPPPAERALSDDNSSGLANEEDATVLGAQITSQCDDSRRVRTDAVTQPEWDTSKSCAATSP